MWCKHCQQDMPGIADGEGAMVCARCMAVLRMPAVAEVAGECEFHAAASPGETNATATSESEAPPSFDDWRLDEQISEAERLLKAFRPSGHADAAWATPSSTRIAAPSPPRRTAGSGDGEAQRRGGWLAWAFLLAGTTALVCGGVLAGWSYFGGRAALWNLGLPVLLGGQASLLLGIVLQVERMWRNGRLAAKRLAEVDRELSDLHQTTTLLGNMYGGGSSTFFAHLAEGASPHLLLSDLKGQMDLLAMKVSRGG